MRLLNGAALTAALLLVAVASPGQSLSDAAAKEKARRKTVPKSGKVITDEDLRTGGGTVSAPGGTEPSPAASPSPGAEGAAKKEEKKEKSEEELKSEAQADWRKRLTEANTEATTARERVNQIQLALERHERGRLHPPPRRPPDPVRRRAEAGVRGRAEGRGAQRGGPPQRLALIRPR